jgi:NADPH:quinone reductase-like Zn-dependent oxidoreductase
MRAAVVVQDAGGKRLEVRDVAKPVPGESEVLVRVRTAGANRADLLMNVGHFRGAGAALAAPVAAAFQIAKAKGARLVIGSSTSEPSSRRSRAGVSISDSTRTQTTW